MTTAPKLIRDLHNIADDIAGISDALLSTNSLRGNQLRAISEHLRTLAAEPAGSTVTIHSGPINILASAEGMYKAKPDSAEGVLYECPCGHIWRGDGTDQNCPSCNPPKLRATDKGKDAPIDLAGLERHRARKAEPVQNGRKALHGGETRFRSKATGRSVSLHYAKTHPDQVMPYLRATDDGKVLFPVSLEVLGQIDVQESDFVDIAAEQPKAEGDVLEIVARYVGKTSNIYRYIRDDLKKLSAAPQSAYLAEISEALEDPTLTSFSQVATGIRDLKSRLSAAPQPEQRFTIEEMERFGKHVADARQERLSQPEQPARDGVQEILASLPPDDFNGDNKKLIASIEALISLDTKGALVPHGIGGHAKALLASAARRLAQLPQQADGGAVAEIGRDWTLVWCGSEPISAIMRQHGLKIGDKLYAGPPKSPGVGEACRCGANAGCTNPCDRSTNRFFAIIEDARKLPPSSREQTLNWILDRGALLAALGGEK